MNPAYAATGADQNCCGCGKENATVGMAYPVSACTNPLEPCINAARECVAYTN